MFEAKFQTFEDRNERGEVAGRVAKLRAELKKRGLDGFVVPRADRHQNEYVPPSEERLAWLTGFTGSAGAAIVLDDRAVLFVDGRYTVQSRAQTDTKVFDIEHLVENPPEQWLDSNLKAGTKLGYDPWLHTADHAEKLEKACQAAGASLIAVEGNPLDALWSDRPAPPAGKVVLHDIKFSGEQGADKLRRIRAELTKSRLDALLVSDPQNVAWTYNVRGSDVGHTPLPLGMSLIPREGRPSVYFDGRKLDNAVRAALEDLADVREPAALENDLTALKGKIVRLDRASAAQALSQLIEEHGGKVSRGADPITLMKAVKNRTEMDGARAAHKRDGAAMARFLAWFDQGGARRQAHRDRSGKRAGDVPPRHRQAKGHIVSEHRRGGAEWRDRALSRHAILKPKDRHRRAVSDQFRRAIRGRHHRHYPDAGGRHPDRRKCATVSPACSRATSPSPPRSSRRARPARSSIRWPASHCGRPGSTSTMAPATASAAISRCMKGRRASPSSARCRCGAA